MSWRASADDLRGRDLSAGDSSDGLQKPVVKLRVL